MLSDPDLLDITRRLRTILSSFDNVQIILEKLSSIEDPNITDSVHITTPDIVASSTKVSGVLKKIEASRQYRDMIKRYNIDEAEEEDN